MTTQSALVVPDDATLYQIADRTPRIAVAHIISRSVAGHNPAYHFLHCHLLAAVKHSLHLAPESCHEIPVPLFGIFSHCNSVFGKITTIVGLILAHGC